MHTYVLKNNQNRPIEIRKDEVLIVRLEPNSMLYFFSPYDDLDPLFEIENVEYSVVDQIEVDPDFWSKCEMIEVKEERAQWKKEGF